MTTARDRNNHYVPDGLSHGGRNITTLGTGDEPLPLRLGLADELNRERNWWWADTSGDGAHWSRFDGHHHQVDIGYRTWNRREVNEWKGRDEIRKDGRWTIAINREQVWEGFCHDVLEDLLTIRRTVQRLLDHDAINWNDGQRAAEQLLGRKVWYERTAAVVSSVSVLDQGCVMLKPEGVEAFPCLQSQLNDADPDLDENDELKVELLSRSVWWWRER